MRYYQLMTVAFFCVLLNACTGLDSLQDGVHTHLIGEQENLVEAKRRFQQSIMDEALRIEQQEVDAPWFTGAARPVARDVHLPESLKNSVDTVRVFRKGPMTLSTIADRIILATGIPVRVQADALLPQARFTSALNELRSQTQVSTSNTVVLPVGKHPLVNLLDLIAHRLGVYWQYDHGAIYFYRTETRSFNVRALSLKTSTSIALGRTKVPEGSFESRGLTRLESENADALLSIKEKLIPFMTRAGVVAANSDGSNLIVVTDTPAALDRIDAFLVKENRAMTRRVRLMFERVEVQLKESAEQGIDWSLIAGALSFSAPNSLVSAVAGSVDIKRSNGSSVIIQALSEIGQVMSHTTIPLQGLNRRPMTHAVRTTFTYIDQVQTTTVASSAGTSTSPSITQKEETVGSFLTVIPDAQDDGQILLSISYDNTVALPLKTLTFGDDSAQVMLQQKTVDGIGTVQQVQVQAGQPIVISGFERTQEQIDRRSLDANLPTFFGGARKSSSERIVTLVILTAQIEEGH